MALVCETLRKALETAPHAPPGDQALTQLMLEDLDREMDLRESRVEAEIAKQRGVSDRTVANEVAPIDRKPRVSRRAALAAKLRAPRPRPTRA